MRLSVGASALAHGSRQSHRRTETDRERQRHSNKQTKKGTKERSNPTPKHTNATNSHTHTSTHTHIQTHSHTHTRTHTHKRTQTQTHTLESVVCTHGWMSTQDVTLAAQAPCNVISCGSCTWSQCARNRLLQPCRYAKLTNGFGLIWTPQGYAGLIRSRFPLASTASLSVVGRKCHTALRRLRQEHRLVILVKAAKNGL